MNFVDKNKSLKWRGRLSPLDPAKVEYIVIHHPAWGIASAETIHSDVLNDPTKKDWKGIGYNMYIRKDGEIDICRGMFEGAQTENRNGSTFGVCFEGDYDKEPDMNEIQFATGVEYLRMVLKENVFPNLKGIVKHSDLCPTGCPGAHFPWGRLIEAVYAKEPDLVEPDPAIEAVEYLRGRGVEIDEERFGDPATRGEMFVLLKRIVAELGNK